MGDRQGDLRSLPDMGDPDHMKKYDRYHRPVVARPGIVSPSKGRKQFVYSVRLGDTEIAQLNKVVRKTGRTASDIFRAALAAYMEED